MSPPLRWQTIWSVHLYKFSWKCTCIFLNNTLCFTHTMEDRDRFHEHQAMCKCILHHYNMYMFVVTVVKCSWSAYNSCPFETLTDAIMIKLQKSLNWINDPRNTEAISWWAPTGKFANPNYRTGYTTDRYVTTDIQHLDNFPCNYR